MRRPLLPLLIAVSSLAFCAAARGASSTQPAESPEDLPEATRYNFPPVPEAMWEAYAQEVKARGWPEVADALRQERVQPRVDEWATKLNQPLKADYAPYLEVVGMQRNSGTLRLESSSAQGGVPRAPSPPPPTPVQPASGDQRPFWALRPNHSNQAFLVPASKVSALRFPVLQSITATHPLNEKVPELRIDGASLLTVIRNIMDSTGVPYDYAINRSAADVQVSLRLSGRTRFECLRMAVETANFELATRGFGIAASVDNPRVTFHNVTEAWSRRLTDPAAMGSPPPKPHELVEEQLRKMLDDVRQGRDITIGLRPRFPSTDVKVNVDESGRRR